jgi:DNA-binding MarR family transcriptional regulator
MEEVYDSQVTTVVRGFMHVWNRFEATLGKELAGIQAKLQGMDPQRVSPSNGNYELFYRACSGIYPKGSVTMGEFGSALSVPLSTATRIADWLVERDYILRLPDAEDRRVVKVALTDKGKELYQVIDKYIRQRVMQVLDSLTEEERAILLTLVSKLLSGFRQAAG